MNMDINETGKHNGMMKINGNSARNVQPPGDGNNTAILNGNINRAETVFRKQRTVFQQILQGTRSLPRPRPVSNFDFLIMVLYRIGGCAVNTEFSGFFTYSARGGQPRKKNIFVFFFFLA